jgi:hypothetical protein
VNLEYFKKEERSVSSKMGVVLNFKIRKILYCYQYRGKIGKDEKNFCFNYSFRRFNTAHSVVSVNGFSLAWKLLSVAADWAD